MTRGKEDDNLGCNMKGKETKHIRGNKAAGNILWILRVPMRKTCGI